MIERITPSAEGRGPTTPSDPHSPRASGTGTWSALAVVRAPSGSTRTTDVGPGPQPSRTDNPDAPADRDHNGLHRLRAAAARLAGSGCASSRESRSVATDAAISASAAAS